MKPNLLVVSHNLSYGGATLALYNLVRASVARFNVDLLALKQRGGPSLDSLYANLGVRRVERASPRRYDLVIANTISAAPVVRKFGRARPVVWWIHEERPGQHYLARNPADTEAFDCAAAIVLPSRWQRDTTYRQWLRSREDAVHVIPNAAWIEPAPPAEPSADGHFRILHVGYESRIKGQDLTVAAVERLGDERIRVGFVGHKRQLEQDVAARGLGRFFTWHGQRRVEEVHALMRAADLVCQPSRIEAQGISILEAMALGKPVVASDLPTIREVLTHGVSGLLSPPGDHRVLAGNIAMLMNDPQLRLDLAREAKRVFEAGFSPGIHLQAFARLLDAQIGGKVAAPAEQPR